MGYIIFYILFAFITQILTYKYVKRIDMKERKFLKKWELEYISAYKEIWKRTYFDKLAEEKKIHDYEEELKKEKQEQKEALKKVTINDEFKQEYNNNLAEAIERLEAQE